MSEVVVIPVYVLILFPPLDLNKGRTRFVYLTTSGNRRNFLLKFYFGQRI